MFRLATRQVHLDFHTSDKIADVAKDFNKNKFQEAIKKANLNSITVFGKCHHGYCYYPTKVGTSHPTMQENMDLAGQMMDACHEIGVKSPLYLTLGWSVLDAKEHPEWIVKDINGKKMGNNYDEFAQDDDIRPDCSWWHLCYAGGYRNYLYNLTKEVCERYKELDGLFFDIVFLYDRCYCDDCKAGMKAKGYHIENELDAKKYLDEEKAETLEGIKAILAKYHPNASIFFNSGGAEVHKPKWHYLSTHFELEDLPTSWGGYDKMPIRAKYFAGKGKDYLGMTGKFHTLWGEFGGYKLPKALKYECASMMTWGARVSVGDQLHPLGTMDMQTYENIGVAFSYAEKIENYCFDASETTKLGLIINTESQTYNSTAKLLLDCHLDFDIIRSSDKVKDFEVIIVEENMPLNDEWAKDINNYIANGGKLLMLGGSCLKASSSEFAINLPFKYCGKSEYVKDYIEVEKSISKNMMTSPILCYTGAHVVKGEGEYLANIRQPYFNRTYGEYCSHSNTPYKLEQASYPAAIKNGNIIYIAHEIATMYHDYGSAYHRRYFENILNLLYTQKNVVVDMPVSGRIRYTQQKNENRYVLHMLLAFPHQREKVCVLEDFTSIYNVPVEVVCEKQIKRAVLIPQNMEIEFTQKDKKVKVIVPELNTHQIVSFEY